MPNMTLALPAEIHSRMKAHKEVRWSEVARQAIADYLKRLEIAERLEQILNQSSLESSDIVELDAAIKAGIAGRHREW